MIKDFVRFIFILLLCALPLQYVRALGVSPGEVSVLNVLPGTQVERKLIISRGNPIETEKIQIIFDEKIKNYIVAPLGTEVILPEGQQRVEYPFTIDTTNLTVGSYKGKAIISYLTPTQEKVSGSAVLPALEIEVKFSVTQKPLYAEEFRDIRFSPLKEKTKLQLSFIHTNNGNVKSELKTIELEIMDKTMPGVRYGASIDAALLHTSNPFSEKNQQIDTGLKLPPGYYTSVVSFKDVENNVLAKVEVPLLHIERSNKAVGLSILAGILTLTAIGCSLHMFKIV